MILYIFCQQTKLNIYKHSGDYILKIKAKVSRLSPSMASHVYRIRIFDVALIRKCLSWTEMELNCQYFLQAYPRNLKQNIIRLRAGSHAVFNLSANCYLMPSIRLNNIRMLWMRSSGMCTVYTNDNVVVISLFWTRCSAVSQAEPHVY